MKKRVSLSIIVTVVSGEPSLRETLSSLLLQIDPGRDEVIVPWDKWCREVGKLASEFSWAAFPFIDELGPAAKARNARDHSLYDRRRAVGLGMAKGEIIAMLEDRGVPAANWVEQILRVHEQPFAAIGGAVENSVDRAINRALYYCDFGRFGLPIEPSEAEYISDINVSYKREPLMAVRDTWRDSYQETSVHSAFRSSGEKLYLDGRPVVYQRRPRISILQALGERVSWGRVYARTRSERMTPSVRFLFAAGTIVLPLLISARAMSHMRRQRLSPGRMLSTLVLTIPLSIFWSIGEFSGYFAGKGGTREPESRSDVPEKSIFDTGVIEPNGHSN
jgi:hypothetical protein